MELTEELILETLKATIDYIGSDYPNATKVYKRHTFVLGAKDMAMTLAKRLYGNDSSKIIAFARKIGRAHV